MGEEKPLCEVVNSCKARDHLELLEWFIEVIKQDFPKEGDWFHLGHGLRELISNAFLYGTLELPGGYQFERSDRPVSREEDHLFYQRSIVVCYARYSDRVEISVTQEGNGIDEELFESITDKTLKRADSSPGGLRWILEKGWDLRHENQGRSMTFIMYSQQ